MSTRAIKKLTKKDDLKELEKLNKISIKDDLSDDNDDEETNIPINKFNLVSIKFNWSYIDIWGRFSNFWLANFDFRL